MCPDTASRSSRVRERERETRDEIAVGDLARRTRTRDDEDVGDEDGANEDAGPSTTRA